MAGGPQQSQSYGTSARRRNKRSRCLGIAIVRMALLSSKRFFFPAMYTFIHHYCPQTAALERRAMRAEENLSRMRSKTAQFEFCALHLKMQHQRLSHEAGQMITEMYVDMQSVEKEIRGRINELNVGGSTSTMVLQDRSMVGANFLFWLVGYTLRLIFVYRCSLVHVASIRRLAHRLPISHYTLTTPPLTWWPRSKRWPWSRRSTGGLSCC